MSFFSRQSQGFRVHGIKSDLVLGLALVLLCLRRVEIMVKGNQAAIEKDHFRKYEFRLQPTDAFFEAFPWDISQKFLAVTEFSGGD